MIHKCSCRRWYRLYIGIAVACLAVVPALAQFETRAIQPTAPLFGAFSIASGDFNNDGKPDIAVIDNPYISVLLGNGDGTFQPPSDNDSFVGAEWLAVGDFNTDHKLDVIASGQFGGNDQFAVFLGNGDGTLQSALTYPLTYISGAVAVADFNQDGNLDAVVGQGYGAIDV